ncbi:saccharopine dehydrogenase NADP-binding domain-containing protein [Roseovarius spongiae]|nr:saccharopine dehydrogenase NADP-binding domain-containing protein [Roseovarius spongiae]
MAEGGTFAVLGGYGQLGRAVAELLVREGDAQVAIVGRDMKKAHGVAQDLARTSASASVRPMRADVNDAVTLERLLAEHDVLIHAAPLAKPATEALLSALLRTGGRTVLISHDVTATNTLQAAQDELIGADASVILDAGADPGLPGLVGHLAATTHGTAKDVELVARYRAKSVGCAGLADILDGASDAAWLFENTWRRAGYFELQRKSFPGKLEPSLTMPVYLPELDALVDRHGLSRLALWHGGLNGLADLAVSVRRLTGKLLPRHLFLEALRISVNHFNPPPYGLGVSATATGDEKASTVKVKLTHVDCFTPIGQRHCQKKSIYLSKRDKVLAIKVKLCGHQDATAHTRRTSLAFCIAAKHVRNRESQ